MQTNGRTGTPESDGESAEDSSLSSSSSEEEKAATPISPTLTLYPAYCFKASPTWFTWVKLTAYDVHHNLCEHKNFHHTTTAAAAGGGGGGGNKDTLLLFYHNHPIRFVQLIGVVVNVEDYYEKYWLFTIDDSSGATIEVTCRKPLPLSAVEDGSKLVKGVGPPPRHPPPSQQQEDDRNVDPDEQDRIKVMKKLDNGMVVQVKGQISRFRKTRQLQVDRIVIVSDTNHEMRLVSARVDFFTTVLSRPWVVSDSTRQQLWTDAHDDKQAGEARVLRRRRMDEENRARDVRHARRIQARYHRDEVKRAAAAREAKMAGLRLHR